MQTKLVKWKKLSGEPLAIKNSIDTAYTKVHVLIQAHTSENEIV